MSALEDFDGGRRPSPAIEQAAVPVTRWAIADPGMMRAARADPSRPAVSMPLSRVLPGCAWLQKAVADLGALTVTSDGSG